MDLSIYKDNIKKSEQEFTQKLTYYEAMLSAIDESPLSSSPGKEDQRNQVHQTRVHMLEDQVNKLQYELESYHIRFDLIEREK